MEKLTVETLADALQEPNRPLLTQVLRRLGPERTTAILAETLACEANGGMLTKDGTRRRTPGGTFFQLVKERTTRQERARLFFPPAPTPRQRERTNGVDTTTAPTHPQPSPLAWEEVQAHLATLPQGDATVKVTLIGRPDMQAIRTQPSYVAFRMQGTPPQSLPKGLPPVPGQQAISWLVVIALRQWNRVKDSLTAQGEDKLIIEGYPVVTGDGTHVLMAQRCVSVLQQREKKQTQAETTS